MIAKFARLEFELSTNSNSIRFHNRLFLKVISGYSAAKRHNLAFYEFIIVDSPNIS